MHYRRQFLELIRDQLKTVSEFAGVWIQRVPPPRATFPAVTLYSEQENIINEGVNLHPKDQERVLTISITVWVRGTPSDEKAESDMDKMAELVETVVTSAPGNSDMYLSATDFTVDEEEADIHAITLTYTLLYYTLENSPSV